MEMKRFFRYRGNWNLPWVVQRYIRTSRSGITAKKLANAGLAFLEMKRGKRQVRSRPVVLRIEPVNVCNLRCPRCSCGIDTDPRQKGYIQPEDFRLVLEENRENAVMVRLDGNGEPTLHPAIFTMIGMAKFYGFSVSMSTNFNTPCCSEAEQFIDSGLDRLVVAIDGSTQATHEKYRSGGNLALVEENLGNLLHALKRRRCGSPFLEVQFLDWGYNHAEIREVRKKCHQWGVDRFEVIAPDWAVTQARVDPKKPRRCFWLWFVLTVDWALNYRSCTNAWTLPWPRLNLKAVDSPTFWNHDLMKEARQFNIDRSMNSIASDTGCHCPNCSDMLVVNRPPGYVCE